MSRQAFRGWVVFSIVLMIAWIVADFATVGQLPEDLREFRQADPELTPVMAAAIFGAIAIMVLYLIALAGLLAFWRPARVLYLVATIGGFLLVFFVGPSVTTAISEGLAYLDCALSGFILALLYFSPIKAHFDSPQSAAP
jgi:hypothetical protein